MADVSEAGFQTCLQYHCACLHGHQWVSDSFQRDEGSGQAAIDKLSPWMTIILLCCWICCDAFSMATGVISKERNYVNILLEQELNCWRPSFCGSCCVQDQKEQSSNQQLSLVLRVLVAMFVKNDSGNDAPFVSTLIGHLHNWLHIFRIKWWLWTLELLKPKASGNSCS